MLGKQLIDVGTGIADLFALLVEFELIEADIGNFVGQVLVAQFQLGQSLFLLVEDSRQQQAAAQHADLLVQGLIALVQGVELLLGLQVLLSELVEAVGGAQQVVGQLEVERAFLGQEFVGAGFLRLE
ncbi:hypothetical protein D9M68_794830 [compost metagenome]